ncbi:MAG: Asp-tRNA(Asn)/Glu-tRNA(Gln) amidotransferase subunit GatC, partial [bacterium]
MALERSDVEKIAKLAQLAVSDQEADALVGELSNILTLVERMN